MHALTDYRLQTIGGTVMTFLGFVFWAYSGTISKFMGFHTDPSNSLATIVRQAGILALVLPLAWTVTTIKMERDHTAQWSLKHTLVSGPIVAWAMFFLLLKSASYGRISLW